MALLTIERMTHRHATKVQKPAYDRGFSYLFGGANSNAKTKKGIPLFPEIEANILYLAPSDSADGVHTICAWATAGCIAACLNTSGRGQVTGNLDAANLQRYGVHRARIARTQLYLTDRQRFIDMAADELRIIDNRARRIPGRVAVSRLNGTSDIPWESIAPELFHTFPGVQFYDYTKAAVRARRFAAGKLPTNYHLTFSRSEETSDNVVIELVESGCNVAVVFESELPKFFLGLPVLDGNLHDFRHKDPAGHVVGLTAKARAKGETSGFTVAVADVRRGN